MFYELERENRETVVTVTERITQLREQTPEFIVDELRELHQRLRIMVECPICYETIQSGSFKIAQCGHKYCDNCFSRLDRCAICRRKISKK